MDLAFAVSTQRSWVMNGGPWIERATGRVQLWTVRGHSCAGRVGRDAGTLPQAPRHSVASRQQARAFFSYPPSEPGSGLAAGPSPAAEGPAAGPASTASAPAGLWHHASGRAVLLVIIRLVVLGGAVICGGLFFPRVRSIGPPQSPPMAPSDELDVIGNGSLVKTARRSCIHGRASILRGAFLQVVRAGEPNSRPPKGSEVSIHVEGRFVGDEDTVFLNTRWAPHGPVVADMRNCAAHRAFVRACGQEPRHADFIPSWRQRGVALLGHDRLSHGIPARPAARSSARPPARPTRPDPTRPDPTARALTRTHAFVHRSNARTSTAGPERGCTASARFAYDSSKPGGYGTELRGTAQRAGFRSLAAAAHVVGRVRTDVTPCCAVGGSGMWSLRLRPPTTCGVFDVPTARGGPRAGRHVAPLEARPGADVAGVSPVPPLRRCGRGEPSPGADVAGVSPVPPPARMRQG
jgi:hypothetical protein